MNSMIARGLNLGLDIEFYELKLLIEMLLLWHFISVGSFDGLEILQSEVVSKSG